MKYSSRDSDDTITFYFNAFEWSRVKGVLTVDGTLRFTGDNGKHLELSLSEITKAAFSYYVKFYVVSYRLVMKTSKGTYRLHFQKQSTREALSTIFNQHHIAVQGTQNDKDLAQIQRISTTTFVFFVVITLASAGIAAAVVTALVR